MVSLLNKALEAKVSNRQKKGASAEELELAVAYWRDHVSAHQVLGALGIKVKHAVSFADGWAKKVLRAGLTDGRLTLTVEVESDADADFDKRYEKAKAEAAATKAAVMTPARAVSR